MPADTPLNIAILGASSHIAKGLIYHFCHHTPYRLHLYTRSLPTVLMFLESIQAQEESRFLIHHGYEDFLAGTYDVLINCVGVGTFKKLHGDYSLYFTVTEQYDNLCLQYLQTRSKDTLYISLSSGAVYGRHHKKAVTENSLFKLRVNHIGPEDYYGIARLYTEAKHRSLSNLYIVDLRIFSYFSRFADLDDGYFMTDLVRSILHKHPFRTTTEDIVRDYIHPEDLFHLVNRCIDIRRLNRALDAVSRKPVRKMEILDFFQKQWNLRWEFTNEVVSRSATGAKLFYTSRFRLSAHTGYHPSFTSLQTIQEETAKLLETAHL